MEITGNRAALVVAGGSGKRMKASLPKQFLKLQGRPILIHTLKRFLSFDAQLAVILVLGRGFEPFWEEAIVHLTAEEAARIHVCAGGKDRTNSVANGLETLEKLVVSPNNFWVAIHDAVRPFVTHAMIQTAFEAAEKTGAAVCCVPVKSSLRQKTEDGSQPVDRSQFFHVQTPQTFHLASILTAYTQRPHDLFTDDASLFQAHGRAVEICEGSYDNLKITTPEDLLIAEKLLAGPVG
ncbi:MAG: 2-C-methyl-D-erythritol 4-phosphate cytidylyltransferase [Bacteroidota bacterium]